MALVENVDLEVMWRTGMCDEDHMNGVQESHNRYL